MKRWGVAPCLRQGLVTVGYSQKRGRKWRPPFLKYNFTHINMSNVSALGLLHPQASTNPTIQEESSGTYCTNPLNRTCTVPQRKHIHVLLCITRHWASKVKTIPEYPLVRRKQWKKHLQRDCSQVTCPYSSIKATSERAGFFQWLL